jgi:arylsulfatase K
MNIIHFHAESWDGRMLGCQEFHPALQKATPNIDRLAEEGTNFRNAYCTNPICCPSRANMLSGTYTHTCESWNNFKGLEQGMWTYDKGLRKTHDMLIVGKHDDHKTGGHSVMNRIADFLEPLNIESYPVMNDDAAQEYSIAPDREIRCHKGDWANIDRVVEFIKSKKESDKPFFISINPGLVHAAFRTNEYWLEKIPEELVDIPPMDDTNHPHDVYQRKSKGWRHGLDEETVKTIRRIYFAMCAEGDALVGEVMNALEDAGLENETTVIFSSDHGELALEHQQYYKMSLLEGSARVPLIMKGPGIKPGQLIETPVSLIDMAPTICEISGMEKRECFEGESLMPMARGETTECRGWALASYSGVTSNTFTWMLVKDEYKIIVHEGYKHRLFNLKEDPAELNDLIDKEPEKAAELLSIIDKQVDRKETLRIWEEYKRHNFAQFQRQAKKGLYHDNSYSLRNNPSSDYNEIIDNALTGWTNEDEERVKDWLEG